MSNENHLRMDKTARTSRRSFLAATASASAVAAGFSADSLFAQSVPSVEAPSRKIGWAIVGIGRLSIGQLLPAFERCKFARIAALVSGDADKAKRFAKQYNVGEDHIYSYATFDRLANDDSIDVVYIVLPNSMHAEYTIRAAKLGKHVFCEKPMANNVEDCKKMIDACSAAKKKLAIAYRVQYDPYMQAAIDLCRRQVIGKTRLITADRGFNIGPGTWRIDAKLAGGGALVDVGIYCLNAARCLMGAEPTEVTAQIDQPKDDPRFKEVEASMAFTLKFPSGALACCTTTYAGDGGSRLRAMGEFSQFLLEPAFNYSAPKMWVWDRGQMQQLVRPAVNQFATEMDEFSRAILENKPVRTPGEEGLADARVIQALYESAREGRAVRIA